jgi:hypothetical protein
VAASVRAVTVAVRSVSVVLVSAAVCSATPPLPSADPAAQNQVWAGASAAAAVGVSRPSGSVGSGASAVA